MSGAPSPPVPWPIKHAVKTMEMVKVSRSPQISALVLYFTIVAIVFGGFGE